MNSLLEFIEDNKKNIDKCWEKKLISANVFEEQVDELYACMRSKYEANVILSFIVFAYDHRSEWIEIHKDRFENKKKIMLSIAGISAMTNEKFKAAVERTDAAINKVIDWYIDFQKDWRWTTIVACFEYHSEVMQMKPSSNAKLAKETLDIGKCIDEAIKRRREGNKLWEEIKKEFVNLDSALDKEGVKKITERIDFMSHEQFISKINK